MVNDVGFRSERGPVLVALMVTTGLVAIDATVLATAIPSIVSDLGGFNQFPWLFSIYLLGQAVTTPIYAKLADLFGRKPIILFGVGMFLVGSVLCGLAWSMPALIAFRVVQGLGAGAILPMASTILGDIYSVAERARVQGYLASVWAMSSVLGPVLGGVLSQLGIWRFIFFVNLPVGLVGGWLLIRFFHERIERRRHRVDLAGAALLSMSLTLVILALLEGGQAWAWLSWQSIGAFVLGAVLLVAFVLVERRAAEPILPLWVFSRRLLITTTLLSLAIGAVLIGLTSFIPTYLEGSLGLAPVVAGLSIGALTLGWPIASAASGRLLYLRIGFKRTALVGTSIIVLGTAALALTAPTPSVLVVAAVSFVIGLGLGLTAVPTLIAAQSSVPWHERGVVTGANLFARSIGSAVGVAVFGAISNSIIGTVTTDEPAPSSVIAGTTAVLLAVVAAAVAGLLAAVAMPKTPILRELPPDVASDSP